jgi:hypothetical protein
VLLEQRLPAAMVPVAYVFLDERPRLPTGKIDKSRLPLPGPPRDVGAYEPPHTETEWQLAGIWSELLHVGNVGRRDDFFALGGHSLLATRLINKVETGLGMRLPLVSLFENPTLARMALHLDLRRVVGVNDGEKLVADMEVDEL